MTPAAELVASLVRRLGPLPFDEVMDLALYHPEHGFYTTGGQAGRRGDFLTSPEVGPLFGAVLARALDLWWAELGQPDPFIVVEAGAGVGSLARAVLGAAPACAGALRYVLVERSAELRAAHGDHLQLMAPAFVLGPVVTDADGIEQPAERDAGPLVTSLEALPKIGGPVVVLANELLDNLAFHVLERAGNGWNEVRVGLAPGDHGFVEITVPADDARQRLAARLAPAAPVGGRLPVQDRAAAWLRDALDLAAGGGRVVVFDYASETTAALAERPTDDWLRTYVGHHRGGGPLERLGQQDITVEVCVDQLTAVQAVASDRSQVDFLAAHGIRELVEEGRQVWQERAHVGDLPAVKARSRIGEADLLCDPDALGAFRVLEWTL